MSKFKPIHQHLMIKARIQDPISDPELAKQLLSKLVKEINMTPVTAPQSVYIYDPGNEGLTGSINLATSHIAYHIWDDAQLLMADVYSCKPFDSRIVINFFREHFGVLTEIEVMEIDRETWHTAAIIQHDM